MLLAVMEKVLADTHWPRWEHWLISKDPIWLLDFWVKSRLRFRRDAECNDG